MRLLVTRPDPEAQRTAAKLRTRGHKVHVAAVLRIEAILAGIGEGPWTALLMTSANAARSVSAHPALTELQRLPVLVVGARTAEAARRAGFIDVVSADGNAADLVPMAAGRFGGKPARLLYLAGEQTAFDLAGALGREGLEVKSIEVYRAVAAQGFPPKVDAALRAGSLDGVLHFSRRSAAAYLSCAARAQDLAAALRPVHYCLSAQVAATLTDAGAAQVLTAQRPDEAALLALID